MTRCRRDCLIHSAWCTLRALLFLYVSLNLVTAASAQPGWPVLGPDGGDARSIASVPGNSAHLYLGTASSWLYESADGGASWHRLAKIASSDDLIVDHILVDAANPKVVFVAAWKLRQKGGGLYVSRDGGVTWAETRELKDQPVFAFAQAPSNPNILVAGTLAGVYRSSDSGATWTLISPPGSKEIHEVESLAIDPVDPDVIYAGTWHLPWKTGDGGKSWRNVKRGVIDDSDVFSIIIDPKRPRIVYASACSGIYKSESAGDLFHKIQGIPSTARRTRVLRQDHADRETVYAGTTEGLYKTTNGGRTFKRLTSGDVIVNDVYVDPENPAHVLLATDRGGVLLSNDAGVTFAQSNRGFSGRKVEALLVDSSNPAKLYAGVVNDKTFGGVFATSDSGANWKQIADGLDGRDVFVLAQSADGAILAGTNSGIFALPAGATSWQPRSVIANTLLKTQTENVRGTRVTIQKEVKDQLREMDSRVFALDFGGEAWLASTAGGLYTSRDQGATWQGGPVMGVTGYLSVAALGPLMAAARPDAVVLSKDGGKSWWPMSIPTMLTRIHRVVFSPDGTLWLGAREGVYFTRDKGKTWMWVNRFPLVDVDDVFYDTDANRVLASSRSSDFIYAIDPKTLGWQWRQTGHHLTLVRAAGGRLLAASLYDGVLREP